MNTSIRLIRRDVGPTNDRDEALMPMTDPQLSERSVEKQAKCGYGLYSIRPKRLCASTSIGSLKPAAPSIPMSIRVTIILSVLMRLSITVRKNGLGMMMAMASGRFIATRPKGCGRMFAIFCVRSKGCIKSTFMATLPFVNSDVI